MNPPNISPSFQQISTPPPPPVFDGTLPAAEPPVTLCVKCSDSNEVALRKLEQSYIPPLAYIAVLLGPLLGLIVLAALRVKHDVKLPFCKHCWRRIQLSNAFQAIALLSVFAAMIFGVVLMLNLDSGWAFFIFPLISAGLVVWAQIVKRRAHPKVKKIDRNEVIIAAGPYGDVSFSRTMVIGTAA
jgi:hypothetical protein